MSQNANAFPAQLSSQPEAVRRFAWAGGSFSSAYRPATALVEGEIHAPHHLVMVTLQGGAKRHEIRADGGHRYDGVDRPGSVSFLPALCRRSLRLHGVEWRWATIAIAPGSDGEAGALAALGPFSGVEDVFVQGMLAEFERLDALDGGLDPIWRERMVQALVTYLATRYAKARPPPPREGVQPLAAWQLRLARETIAAGLSGEIRVGDLAAACGLSEGHFHRAFRAATGVTPLRYVNARRVEAAELLLAKTRLSIGVVALKVGFLSASHFARVFREASGRTPQAYRRSFAVR